jgi:glucose-1-phosphate adenylyltransferase
MPLDLIEPVALELNSNNKVTDIVTGLNDNEKCNWSLGIYVMKKAFLQKTISEAVGRNRSNFVRDILQLGVLESKIYGYAFDGYVGALDSMQSYFNINMDLMNMEVLRDLFNPMRPIYTKVRDEMPARYGLGSNVTNSIIADGCVIEGEVENCVLFRGVHVGKGAKITNSIIMQDTIIGENTVLDYVVSDKDVVFNNDKSMIGVATYPVYVSKGSIV